MNRFFLLVIIMLVSLNSCKKSGQTSNTPLSAADYPLKLDDQWTYRITDSLNGTSDTVTLKIANSRTAGDTTWWYCNVYIKGVLSDTPYYRQTPNELLFSGSSYSYFSADFQINFPVSDQSVWGVSYLSGDTAKASLVAGSITIAGKPYSGLYKISRSFIIPDFGFSQSIYLYRGIGLVEEDFDIIPFGPRTKKNVQLISFHLN